MRIFGFIVDRKRTAGRAAAEVAEGGTGGRDLPVREVDVSRHFRWLVRVTVSVSVAQAEKVADLCTQFGWGLRPDEGSPAAHPEAVSTLFVEVPMIGAKRGVCAAAGRRALKELTCTGARVRRGATTLVEPDYHPPRDYHVYRGFARQEAGETPGFWQRRWVLMGFRDTGSVSVYPGETPSVKDLVPEGHYLRTSTRVLPPGEPLTAPVAGPLLAKTWQVVLVCIAICAVGLAVLLLMPPPPGIPRLRAYLIPVLGLYIGAGCYQFVRDRASWATALAVIPIGVSVLPQFTQMIAEAKIDAYLYQFGLSSAYMNYVPGTTLTTTLRPIVISVSAMGVAIASFGWIRFFAHTQHWLEWVFLALVLPIYTLSAVVAADQAGQREGAQAIVAVRSHGSVPDLYGYTPSVACITPLSANVAYQGTSLPTTWATLVFGSSGGQTAVWDPRTGQTTLVSTDDVRIIPVGSLQQACSR